MWDTKIQSCSIFILQTQCRNLGWPFISLTTNTGYDKAKTTVRFDRLRQRAVKRNEALRNTQLDCSFTESALLTICVSNDIATLAGYLEAVRMFYCKEAQ